MPLLSILSETYKRNSIPINNIYVNIARCLIFEHCWGEIGLCLFSIGENSIIIINPIPFMIILGINLNSTDTDNKRLIIKILIVHNLHPKCVLAWYPPVSILNNTNIDMNIIDNKTCLHIMPRKIIIVAVEMNERINSNPYMYTSW